MNSHWQSQKERGSALGIAILFATARWLGRGPARLMLRVITFYFVLFAAGARATSRQYLQRVLARPVGWRDLWQHFFTFSSCTLDRIFLLTGSAKLEIDVQQSELVLATARQGGALLLVSHFGSFEAMRAPGTRDAQLPLSILMDRAHGARFTAVLEQAAPEFSAQVIDANQSGPALVLQLKAALSQGRLVGIMADRARGDEATVPVQFLGGTAQLPLGPWQLALALRCPVLLGFAVYRGGRRYEARFELFSPGLDAPRGQRSAAAATAAQAYAQRMECAVRDAPYNWFNFYNFWD